MVSKMESECWSGVGWAILNRFYDLVRGEG
jgi:hypothetical protein